MAADSAPDRRSGSSEVAAVTGLKLAPSILTADFARLGEEVASVAPLVDWFHLDVMDGHYVPNITFGPDIVAALREAVETPFHVHLMIEEPAAYIRRFAEAGAQRISFHPEVVKDVSETIHEIVSHGAGAGIAVHPDVALTAAEPYLDDIEVLLMMTVRPGFGGQSFMHEVVPKIKEARALLDGSGSDVDIEVDGGVNLDTVHEAIQAGANILVAGSAIFDGVDAPAAARRLRVRIEESEGDFEGREGMRG